MSGSDSDSTHEGDGELEVKTDPETAEMANNMKYKLASFNGLGNADDFLSKFELLKTTCKWNDKEAGTHLALHLEGPADTWMRTEVKAADRDVWDTLSTLFKKRWITLDPQLLVEQRLLARKLQPGETLEEYLGAILDFSNRLGRTADQMAANFVNGLPEAVKDNVLSGDSHDLTNYVRRAKMYMARNPQQRQVTFDAVHAVTSMESTPNIGEEIKREVVSAVSEMFSGLQIQKSQATPVEHPRSPSPPDRHRRSRRDDSRDRYRKDSSNHSPYRNDRYRRNSYDRFRSSSRYRDDSRDRRRDRDDSRDRTRYTYMKEPVSHLYERNSRDRRTRSGSRPRGSERIHYVRERSPDRRQNYGQRRRGPSRNNDKCHYCNIPGHWWRQCRKYQRDNGQAPPNNWGTNNNTQWGAQRGNYNHGSQGVSHPGGMNPYPVSYPPRNNNNIRLN